MCQPSSPIRPQPAGSTNHSGETWNLGVVVEPGATGPPQVSKASQMHAPYGLENAPYGLENAP